MKLEIKSLSSILKQPEHGQIVFILMEKFLSARSPLGDVRDQSGLVQLFPGTKDTANSSEIWKLVS